MLDQIRQMIVTKFELRRKIGRKMVERIILAITKALNAQTKNIKGHEVLICGNGTVEVTIGTVRHAVNLGEKTCSSRAWQVCGKPCMHTLATIAKVSSQVNIEDFVWKTLFITTFLLRGLRRLMKVLSNQ